MTTIIVTVQVHETERPNLSIAADCAFTVKELQDMRFGESETVKAAAERLLTKVKTAWIKQGLEWD